MKKLLLPILFASANLIFIGQSFGSDEKIGVTSEEASLSPSGSEILFSADFDGEVRIWASNLDGSNLRKISKTSKTAQYSTPASETQPVWAPNGRSIAYVSSGENGSDIWLMNVDGNYPIKLTVNGASNSDPAWSPDGSKIAFIAAKGRNKDLWIMNADGTGQVKLLSLLGQENRPSFSPSGDKIVFSETINGGSNLMAVNANGSGAKAITSGNFRDWSPNWGPNGIVFTSNRDASSSNWKLWIVQPDGTGLQKLGDVVGQDPVWTRDGKILFTDELIQSRANGAVSLLNPQTRTKHIVVNVQGYFTPIDLRPSKASNNINPQSNGKVEVAILSTKMFDAPKMVDQGTISFGQTGNENSLSNCSKKYKDLNNDGLPDLRCWIRSRNTGFQKNSSVGILRFLDLNGKPYEGQDKITIVNVDDPDDFKSED